MKKAKQKKVVRTKKVTKEDSFWDGDDKNVNAEEARVINPSARDVYSEISSMDSFRDFDRERRGNGLTYGDY